MESHRDAQTVWKAELKEARPPIVVIGCGTWGMNHLRVWRELGCLRAACDSNPARLEVVRSHFSEVDTYSDVRAMLDQPDVRAVVIATPAPTHAPLALQALLAGKDVLVEKPMALAVDEAVQLVNAARRFNRVLMVGHVMLYHPAIERLQRLFEEGALGRVQYIYANRLNLGRIRAEESVLWSFAPHDVAIMLRLLREMPQEVTCRGGTYLRPGVPDVTLTSLDFPSGVQGHIFVSWLHPFKEHRFVVVGDRHMAVVNDTGSWREVLLLYPHRVNRLNGEPPVAHKAEAVRVPLEEVQPLRVECEHFLRCVVTREQPLTDGESGVQVLRVLESAQRSLEQGGRVIRPNVSPRMEHAS